MAQCYSAKHFCPGNARVQESRKLNLLVTSVTLPKSAGSHCKGYKLVQCRSKGEDDALHCRFRCTVANQRARIEETYCEYVSVLVGDACAGLRAYSLAEPASVSSAPRQATPQVVLTRESGKNKQLASALAAHGIDTLELPLVETRTGPDQATLAHALGNEQFEWITITSPEAASVFMKAWTKAGSPSVSPLSISGYCLTAAHGRGLALNHALLPLYVLNLCYGLARYILCLVLLRNLVEIVHAFG